MVDVAIPVKLGFVGPAHGNLERLRALCERCLFEWEVDRVMHLGSDDTLDRAVHGWAERVGAPRDEAAFLDEVAALAPDAESTLLDDLLARDARRARLGDVLDVAGLAVELAEDRIVLVTGERVVPDEDDLANATVVVQGRSQRPELRAVGARALLMPGDANAHGHAGLVELTPRGLRVALYDLAGRVVRELTLPLRRGAKMEVRT